MSRDSESKIYVGELGNSADQDEIENAFSYYGQIRSVWIARNPPGFAFVDFEDVRDAKDAVRGMHGKSLCGKRVIVEMSNGRKRGPRGGNRGRGGGYRDSGQGGGRCYECSEYGHFAASCPNRRNGGGGGRRSYRSRSRERAHRRSHSRDSSPDRRSRSR